MAEYISRETALKKLQMQLLDLEADQDKGEYSELCENRGARDALDEAIYDIRTLKAADVQPVNQWISVKDRLPNEDDCYLVVIESEICVSIDIAEYSENRWHKHDKVLYWQPLPEPPKDGDAE